MNLRFFSLILLLPACNRASGPAPSPSSSQAGSETEVAPSSPSPVPTAPPPSTAPEHAAAKTWDFNGDTLNKPPLGFAFGSTGSGRDGRWIVRAEVDAPSPPNVLAQVDADDTNARYPIAVANEPSLRDMRVRVRCKMVSGRVDQACGIVVRYVDRNNYFITRANALENNIRLYTVRDGSRQQIAGFSGTVTPNAWHDYRLDVRGDHLEVFWDGKRVIDHHDSTFTEPGRIGVWTKADSVTYFDDLRIEAL